MLTSGRRDMLEQLEILKKERDAALAESARHKAELERWCADAERLMGDVVLPKSKAIEEERDAALGRVEALEKAAREVVFAPVGKRRATCSSEALFALERLLPDDMAESKEGE